MQKQIMNSEDLNQYLEKNSKYYGQDKYSMSIRELASMYSEKEINLSPVYQRLFRWGEEKASKLIESIILGIPLPPIFVSIKNGKWEIVDGVQRMSSILWFLGKLQGEKYKSPLILSNLEILEKLNGYSYETLKSNYSALFFKFFDLKRIDINLLVSDEIESEYELFSRLNTGGVELSAQEIRNFLISKLSFDTYQELRSFKNSKLSKSVLTVSDKQSSEDYEMELLVYLLIIINSKTKFNGKLGLDLFEENSKKYYSSRDKFIDVCITDVLKNQHSIKSIKYISKIFEKIHFDLPKRPFANGTKFSPFLYICLISFIQNFPNNNKNLKDIISLIQSNQTYKEKAKRGTNVVNQFISGIKIGQSLLDNE